MKRWMWTLFIPVVLLITPPQAESVEIIVSPVSQSIGIADSAQVALQITGLGDHQAPSLSTFDLDVMFDSSVLVFNSFTYGDLLLGDQLDLLGLGSITSTTPGADQVNVFELSLDPAATLNALQAPAFVLGTLSFGAVAIGESPVTITINALGDSAGTGLPASTQGGSVTVTAVPEPSTVSLFLGGLIGLLAAHWIWRPRLHGTKKGNSDFMNGFHNQNRSVPF